MTYDDPDPLDMVILAEDYGELSPPARGCIWLAVWLVALLLVGLSALVARFALWALT